MQRGDLLLCVALSALGCSQSSGGGDVDPSPGGGDHAKGAVEPTQVDFRFARVLERDPALDRLMDFIAEDEQGRADFRDIRVSLRPGTPVAERVLEGADRDALIGYLRSVFSREPGLKLPARFDTAFGTAPADSVGRPGPQPVRAYWLETTSQLEFAQVRSATVVEDNIGGRALQLTLGEEDKEAFGRLTEAAVGHKVAIVRGDEIISAPVVNEPITQGVLRITMGDPTARSGPDAPEALAQELLGGRSSPREPSSAG